MIRICDLMQKGVMVCYPHDSVWEVSRLMESSGVYAVVVAHETGEVWGLVSVLEVIRYYGINVKEVCAEDIMRPYKIEVDPQMEIDDAARLMRRRRIEHLIVVDPHAGPKRPIGLLSSSDIVRHMSRIATGQFTQILVFPSP
ncbi:MAG: CBS domain-containing protein [Syntrophobacteraceae bacterium]|nr:CBS domain-containing protein [Syntrophobacteraceae bacterium]